MLFLRWEMGDYKLIRDEIFAFPLEMLPHCEIHTMQKQRSYL